MSNDAFFYINTQLDNKFGKMESKKEVKILADSDNDADNEAIYTGSFKEGTKIRQGYGELSRTNGESF